MNLIFEILRGIISYSLPEATPFLKSEVKTFSHYDDVWSKLENLDQENDELHLTNSSPVEEQFYFEFDELPFEVGSYDETEIPNDSWMDSIDFGSGSPDVNVDGTPMLEDTWVDIHGDAYGCPSSLCDDDWL